MKRIIAFLMSLMLVLSLCACTPTETPETTAAPTNTETTAVTEVVETVAEDTTTPSLTESAEDLLGAFVNEFDLPADTVEIVRTSIPDFFTFDMLEPAEDGTSFIITMTDGVKYIMVVDENGIVSITANVETPTERDIFYVR